MNVIRAERLTRRFGQTVAVNGLDLEVSGGEVFGFLGHNGAGKTTTVRLLNGILSPSGGKVTVLGLSPERSGAELRRRTGVLTETPAVDERLSARENLELFGRMWGLSPADAVARAAETLSDFGLAERADERVRGYSKGMKQRLALSRVLLHRPELLFLDEPTAGLDPVASREVHELIRSLKKEGRTVFLTTHNLAEAQALCDRVAVLERGAVRAIGTPEELSRRLGGGRLVLELDAASRAGALSLLGSAARELEDGRLELRDVRREDIPALVERLVHSGARLYRVGLEEPSLEDVYFALHEEAA